MSKQFITIDATGKKKKVFLGCFDDAEPARQSHDPESQIVVEVTYASNSEFTMKTEQTKKSSFELKVSNMEIEAALKMFRAAYLADEKESWS